MVIEVTEFDGHPLQVDREADMGYIAVREHRRVHRTDARWERDGVLVDRDDQDAILGIEVFLRGGEVRPESASVIRRLLREAPPPGSPRRP